MMGAIGVKYLFLTLSFLLSFSLYAKTLSVDEVTPSVTNGDFTITPNGTGDIILGTLNGILKGTSGVLSAGTVDLSSETSSVLPASGGGLGTDASAFSGVLKVSTGTFSASALDLTADVTGVLPVANGGTGSASQNFVDLSTTQTVGGAKTFSAATDVQNRFTVTTTGQSSIPCPKMTEAQRDALSSPVSGDCVYNTDASALNVYDGASWGSVGGGGVGSSSIYGLYNAESDDTADFTENSVTLSLETTSELSGTASYTFSVNDAADYLDSPTITLSTRSIEKSLNSVSLVVNADSDDFVLQVIDNGSNVLATEEISSTDTFKRLFFYVDSSTSIKLRIIASNYSSGTGTIIFDDLEFNDSPDFLADINQTISVRAEGNGGTSVTASVTNIPFTEVTDTDGAFDGTTYTVQRSDSSIQFSVSVAFTASGGRNIFLYKNGSAYKQINKQAASSELRHKGEYVSIPGELVAGDLITVRSVSAGGTLSNSASQHYFNVVESFTSEFVTTPATANTETVLVNGYTSKSSNRILFKTEVQNTTSKLLDYDTSGGYHVLTALRECSVVIGFGARLTSSTAATLYVRNSGGTERASITVFTGGSGQSESGGTTIELDVGDYIQVETAGTPQDFTSVFMAVKATPLKATLISATPVLQTCYVSDTKSAGTAGGSSSSGSFQDRVLQTTKGDCDWLSLSSNEISLSKGKYLIKGWSVFVCGNGGSSVGRAQSRFYDTTNTSTVQSSNPQKCVSTNDNNFLTHFNTSVDIDSTTNYKLQYRVATAIATTGLGVAANFGEEEVYSMIEITKVK